MFYCATIPLMFLLYTDEVKFTSSYVLVNFTSSVCSFLTISLHFSFNSICNKLKDSRNLMLQVMLSFYLNI